MTIYVFGNPDHQQDNIALTTQKQLEKKFPDIDFVIVKPNQDLPFENKTDVILMDVVKGLPKATLIQDHQIEKLLLPPRNTAHDFGLGFQLKYMKKLGKLGKVTIIGLPYTGNFQPEDVESLITTLTK